MLVLGGGVGLGFVSAAAAAIEPLVRDRLAGRCADAAAAGVAGNELRALIAARAPFIRATKLLLDAALLAGDGPTALEAWRSYLQSHASILRELDADLVAEHGITARDYAALLYLAQAPDRKLPMSVNERTSRSR